MNTQIKADPLIGLYVFSISLKFPFEMLTDTSSCVTFALMAAALVPMLMLVNATPDRIPADVILEEEEAQQEKKIVGLKSEA